MYIFFTTLQQIHVELSRSVISDRITEPFSFGRSPEKKKELIYFIQAHNLRHWVARYPPTEQIVFCAYFPLEMGLCPPSG